MGATVAVTEAQRLHINTELDLDTQENENLLKLLADPGVIESHRRLKHAQVAFPGMQFPEFVQLTRMRGSPKGKRGPKPITYYDSLITAGQPMFMAAYDFDRIREKWPDVDRGDAINIAAERHDVDADKLDELVRRTGSRRHDRIARQ